MQQGHHLPEVGGKAGLVITAVRQHAGQPAMAAPDTGSLRSDLLAALQGMRSSLSGQDAALILGLLTAMHRDPELAGTVREQVLQAKRKGVRRGHRPGRRPR